MSLRPYALSALLFATLAAACGGKVVVDAEPAAGGAGGTTSTTTTTTWTTTTTTSTTTTSTTTTTTTIGTGGTGGGEPVDAGTDASPPPVAAVYANSGSALYLLDPIAKTFAKVGDFQGCNKVVDVAVDRTGRIFVTTPTGLFRVDPASAACTAIGGAGMFPNSLAFVPKGAADPVQDALVGYVGATYVRVDETTGVLTALGALGGGYTSSGDLVALPDGRVFLTAKNGPACNDCLVQIDPKSGGVLQAVGEIGAPDVWGLATWGGTTYGFAKGGGVLTIDLATGQGTPFAVPGLTAGIMFWGAGSSVAAP